MNPEMEQLIAAAAKQYNLPVDRFRAQLMAESNLDPRAVNPRSGAAGVAQFMPATAKSFGIDPMDPKQAIPAAALYMRQNLNKFGGDWNTALAAYNWGPGNVSRHGMKSLPGETTRFIQKAGYPAVGGPPGGGPPPPSPVNAGPLSPPQPQLPDLPPPIEHVTLADMMARAARSTSALNRVELT